MILDRKDQKNNIFSRHFCDFGGYHNESGGMPPCLCSFCSPHGLARCVPETVLAGTGTLCRWMIALCAAGKSFVSRSRHREKRPLCAPRYRSDFFVDAQWPVASFSQKRFSLQIVTHLKKAHPDAYDGAPAASRFCDAKTYVTPLDRTGFACYSKRTVCLEGMFSASGTQRQTEKDGAQCYHHPVWSLWRCRSR